MNGRCLKLSANIAALAIFTFAVWRVGSMITPEKIVASCNSPSRSPDEEPRNCQPSRRNNADGQQKGLHYRFG